jgi:hypothetical protein
MRGGGAAPAGAPAAAGALAPIAGGSPEADEPGRSEEQDPGAGKSPHEEGETAETRGGATPGKPETEEAPAPVPGGVAPAPNEPSEPGPPGAPFHPEVAIVAAAAAGLSIFFGIFPSPLFEFVGHAGRAIAGLF